MGASTLLHEVQLQQEEACTSPCFLAMVRKLSAKQRIHGQICELQCQTERQGVQNI